MLLELAALVGGCALAGWLAALLWRAPAERRAWAARQRLEGALAVAVEGRRLEFVQRRLAEAARSREELRARVAEDEALQLQRRTGVFGTLDALGVAALLTVIEMERKSGILIITREHDGGRLACRDGRVLSAHLEGAAFGPRGAVAVYRMLTWSYGRFHFTAGKMDGVKDEIGQPTTHLLMEGCRLVDEATAATEMGPAPAEYP